MLSALEGLKNKPNEVVVTFLFYGKSAIVDQFKTLLVQEENGEVIAERLSARHVIVEYCVEIVCLYICIYLCIYYVTLRNAISPYGEAHTVVLYARAAIARPRDCTFFHNYSTFFHNSTTKWTIRLPISLSMHRPHQRYCD